VVNKYDLRLYFKSYLYDIYKKVNYGRYY